MNESDRPKTEFNNFVEAVRKRPSMYIGSTGFFGMIHYLVCPVAFLLAQRPTRLAVTATDQGFVIDADVAVSMERRPNGRYRVFEEIENLDIGSFEGTVLNALSESLTVEVRQVARTQTLAYRQGTLESFDESSGGPDSPRTTLTFTPDSSVFTVTNLSPEIFKSYLRRLSFLHPGVRFSFKAGAIAEEYRNEGGIVDLFASVAVPYQILHEPIHVVAGHEGFQLEAVLAFQSWSENALWCFINKGRAVEGGTHEKGLRDALRRISEAFLPPKSLTSHRNGVVGVISVLYPGAVWQGCIKARVGNPELRVMVRDAVVNGAREWLERRPEVASQIHALEKFPFPDVWSQ